MDEINLSFYVNVADNKGTQIDLASVIGSIKGDGYEKIIADLRSADGDKKKQEAIKKNLRAVTFSGLFHPTRAIANLKRYTGLICLDFDHPGDVSIETLKKDEFTCIAFVSPRGKGFKIIVRVPIFSASHGKYFTSLEDYYWNKYNLKVDPSGKDVSRLCFLSHDPELFYNPDSKLWEPNEKEKSNKETSKVEADNVYSKKEETQLTNTVLTLHDVWKFTENKISCIEGQRNHFLFLFCANCCRKGFDAASVEAYCLASEDLKTQKPGVIKANVKRAYEKNAAEFGRYAKKEKANIVSKGGQQPSESNRKGSDSESNNGDATSSTQELPNSIKSNTDDAKNYTQFWSETVVEEGKGANKRTYLKYSLRYKEFCRFLGEAGFNRMKTGSDTYQYVYYNDGIITPIQSLRMKDFVISWCDKRDLYGVEEMLRKGAKSYFISQVLDALPYVDVELKADTEDKAFFYYKNCWITVTSTGITTHSYDALDGDIWQASIIDREFSINNDVSLQEENESILNSEFAKFIFLAAHNPNDDIPNADVVAWQRFQSFSASYGYLLHAYKNYSNSKMVVGIDHKVGEKGEQNGGTGKSLAGKALNYMKKVTTISGKDFKDDYPWKYEAIAIDTRIVVFNDVRASFNVEGLFEVVTEDWPINRRHIGLMILPFEQSPKIYLTTNGIPRGDGSSFSRRMHVIEYSDHFHEGHSPYDEFGHNLFGKEWDTAQWNLFDNYMVQCCSLYLSKGLLAYPGSNFDNRKLVDSVAVEFVDWMEGGEVDDKGNLVKTNVEKNHLYNKADLLEKFNVVYSKFYPGKLSPHKFSKWFKQYCHTKGYQFNPHKKGQPDKRNGQEYYVIGDAAFSIDNLKAGAVGTLF